ncbi:MAG: sugar phosphate isomerase/epimerase family protein [Patescibacteria group bacterium]
MKLSAWVTVSDLIPLRQTGIEKVIDFFDNKQTMFHSLSHEYIFSSLKQAGVDGIELLIPRYTSDTDMQAVTAILKKYQMPVLSIHQSLSNRTTITLSEIERLCQISQIFSASVVVLHSGALGMKLFEGEFVRKLKALQKQYHLTFGIENMQRYPFPLPTPVYTYNGDVFAKMVRDAGIGITFDVTHLAQVGEDVTQFYLENKQRIVNIHLSDFKKTWLNTKLHLPDHMHLALGDGTLPLEGFLKTLQKENYKGLITMEINADLEKLCKSASMIKKYVKSV